MNRDRADYVPDYRLTGAYEEAIRSDGTVGDTVCPAWRELSGGEPRYKGEELLGCGATKEVFRTFDSWTMRWVALARLRPRLGPEHYDRFIYEAWINSSLGHPNIISVHDVGVGEDGRPFFTMDLKGDTTLADLATTAQPAALHGLLGVMVKVCDAIAYAHSRRTLHLDLKPENIQANAFGEVLVCDWELGRITGETAEFPPGVQPPDGLVLGERIDNASLSGKITGTPGYMAPEQTIPGSLKDERTDVFALGCILHFILTGEPPVQGGRTEDVLAATREARFPSPRRRFPERAIPASLEAIFYKATAREPADRYESVTALREDLAGYLAGYSTTAENAGFFRETVLLLRRNRLAAGISLLAVVALTVLTVLFVQRLDRQSEEWQRGARSLARNIAKSGNALKNIGIFSNPVKTVDEASQMAAMALTLDPACDAARLEQFDLHCVTLNFQAALGTPPFSGDNPYADYRSIVSVAPDFAFNRVMRPDPGQLAGFLRSAAAVNVKRAGLMERIVAYDSAARRDPEGCAPVVSALLAYANPGWQESDFEYQPKGRVLHIRAGKAVQLAVPPGGGSGKCLLRFLPIRLLRLNITGPADLSGLHQLPVEFLDLRDCRNADFSSNTQLPLLRTVYIAPQSIDPQLLRRRLLTLQPFEIVEHAPRG